MANIQSQIKRNRQALKRRAANKSVRSELKTYLKRFDAALETGDREAAETALAEASRKLDKAARKGVVHDNFAANRKSRMSARLRAL